MFEFVVIEYGLLEEDFKNILFVFFIDEDIENLQFSQISVQVIYFILESDIEFLEDSDVDGIERLCFEYEKVIEGSLC